MIDFTHANDKINNTKLGEFYSFTEGGIRRIKKSNPLRFQALYLGALCISNGINKESLVKIIELNKKEEKIVN